MNSRRKGREGEKEAARLFGGTRISKTGEAGSDVEIGKDEWEVKRVAKLQSVLKSWLEQADDQASRGVIFREDRGEWWVAVRAQDYFGKKDYLL